MLHFSSRSNVDVPNLVTDLVWTPNLYDRYVVSCGSTNGYQKDAGLKDIGLHAEIVIIISRFNRRHNLGDPYDHSMSMKIFTLIDELDIQLSFENHKKSGYNLDLDLITISY